MHSKNLLLSVGLLLVQAMLGVSHAQGAGLGDDVRPLQGISTSDAGLLETERRALRDPANATPERITSATPSCALYPLILPSTVFNAASAGQAFNNLPRGIAPGNFSWITWAGSQSAPTLATSLTPPGDSHTYINPFDLADRVPSVEDYVIGAQGSMNARAVRDALDALLSREITVPLWDRVTTASLVTASPPARGQPLLRIARFARVKLSAYQLTGQGTVSLIFLGFDDCANQPPRAQALRVSTPRNTPVAITLMGSDPDNDALTYRVAMHPERGALSGTPPRLTYTPQPGYVGSDGFTYTVSDAARTSDPALVEITITDTGNRAPLANAQTIRVDEDASIAFTLTGTDPEGAALRFAIINTPTQGTLTGTAPALTYTPRANYHGSDSLRFTVNDGASTSAPATVEIQVRSINDPPTITSTPPTTASIAQSMRYAATAVDIDSTTLTWSVVAAPAGASIDSNSGVLTWTPTLAQVGAQPFEITVSDGDGGSARQAFTITVAPPAVNHAPTITSTPITTVDEGQDYAYDVDATDPDPRDVLRYALRRQAEGMRIDEQSGVIAWPALRELAQPSVVANQRCARRTDTPGAGVAESLRPIYQRIRDSLGRAASFVATTTIAWDHENQCLACHVQAQGMLGLQSASTKTSVDADAAEYLLAKTLRSQRPDGSILTNNDHQPVYQTVYSTWALSFVPDRARTLPARARALEFLWRNARAGDGNVHWFPSELARALIRDGETMSALVAVTAARFDADTRALPQATAEHRALAEQFRSLAPAMAEFFIAHAYDDEPSVLSMAARMMGLTATLAMIDEPGARERVLTAMGLLDARLRALQKPDGGWGELATSPKSDPLITALVGIALDGRRPPRNDPAILRTLDYLLAAQQSDGSWGATTLFTTHMASAAVVMMYLPIAMDYLQSDGDLVPGPMTLSRVDGQWRLDASVINRGGVDITGPITVTARADDTRGSVLGTATFEGLAAGASRAVDIALGNDAPTYNIHITVTPTASTLECEVDNNSASASLIEVEARDIGGLADTQRYLLNVLDANDAPELRTVALPAATTGQPYAFQIDAVDADRGDELRYALTGPTYLAIDALSGLITWHPADDQGGDHAVTVEVTDLAGAVARSEYTLHVAARPANAPPAITTRPLRSAQLGVPYVYDVDAVDPDGDAIAYSLISAPQAMAIDADSGRITWSPALPSTDHPAYVMVRATDARGASSQQAYQLGVYQTLHAPRIEPPFANYTDEREQYRSTAGLIDLDRYDTHEWSLLLAPVGMTLQPETRVLEWFARDPRPLYPTPSTYDSPGNDRCWMPGATVADISAKPRWSVSVKEGSQPVLGALSDSNGDGRIDGADLPAIVAVENDRDVHAIDARTGEVLWQALTNERIERSVVPAIADIDGDGQPEVLVYAAPSGVPTLTALDAKGAVQWRADVAPSTERLQTKAIVVADITRDPGLEIFLGKSLYDAKGHRLFALPSARDSALMTPIDVDGDGRVELLYADELYSNTGALLRRFTADWRGFVYRIDGAMANLDDDPALEYVASVNAQLGFNSGRIGVFDDDGRLMWMSAPGVEPGLPIIGDLTGDGEVDIYAPGYGAMFRADGTTRWTKSAAQAAVAVAADLNQDGAYELLTYDFGAVSVIGAHSGRRNDIIGFGVDNRDRTLVHPVVVDVDGDGHAEVLAGHANTLTLYESDSEAWGPASSADPQHLMSLDDDGQPSTSYTENLRIAQRAATDAVTLPDLAFETPEMVAGPEGDHLQVTIINRGLRDIRAPFRVILRAGTESRQIGTLGELTLQALEAGTSQRLTFDLPARDTMPGDAVLTADPDHVITECATGNNVIGIGNAWVRVVDSAGLSTEQYFATHLRRSYSNAQLSTAKPTTARTGEVFRHDVRGSTAEPGANYQYRLFQGPSSMRVHPNTGEVTWTPSANQVGTHTFIVQALMLLGGEVRQAYTVDVVAGAANTAPVITSTPPLQATAERAYVYDVIASDADGDALTYRLNLAPTGMHIDASTGHIAWTPTSTQVGTARVDLEVRDSKGATATQRFAITVSAAIANRPPTITSTPSPDARATREYRYDLDATDEDGDALVYSLISAPPGMQIDPATGLIRWTPVAEGKVDVTARVADAKAYVDQSWTITVNVAESTLKASVTATPQRIAPGGSVTLSLQYTGAAGAVTRALTVDGVPVSLDAKGEASFTSSVVGRHIVAGTVTDPYDTATASTDFFVSDPSDTEPPIVQLLAPADASEISAPTPVRGTVTDQSLAYWVLAVRPANSPEVPVTEIARGTHTFTDQDFARFDPTLMLNGQYALILQATDTNGRVTSDSVVVIVSGDMKVGHFSITFEDVSIPLAGIPVRVLRTYDTRRKSEKLDFGYGWSLDYQNVRVQESRRLGLSWRVQEIHEDIITVKYCIVPAGDPTVTVTLPDGDVETFHAKAVPECTLFAPEVYVHLEFEPGKRTRTKLRQTSYGLVRVTTVGDNVVSNIVDPEAPTVPIDPRQYELTTADGMVYKLDQQFGIRQVVDPNGNTLDYSDAGIVHSSGVGIRFVRDAQNRIQDMILPDGKLLSYTYTEQGDLQAKSDQLNQVTQYTYETVRLPHYLRDIIDPRGVRVSRNEYDEDGRLIATIDADGHRVEMHHDIAGRTEAIRDRRGHQTTYLYDDRGRVLRSTNSLSETKRFTYDDDDNLLTETDALGHTNTYTYDIQGNRLTESNALGEVTTSTLDHRNHLLTQVDPMGRTVIANQYDPNSGALLSTKDAVGNTTQFSYDSGVGSFGTGELNSMIDPAGNLTAYLLNPPRMWRVGEKDPLGHVTRYEHDDMGRVIRQIRERTVAGDAPDAAAKGRAPLIAKATVTETTTTTYDDKGRVVRVDQPDGSFTTTQYDGNDKPTHECDSANRCTVTTYDARGNVSRIDYSDGTFETKTYDENGNVTAETDRQGHATRMVYDAADRLIETIQSDQTPDTDADNPRTTTTYDAAGRVLASTDELGRVSRYEYDAAGRRTKIIQSKPDGAAGNGPTTITEYDAAGRRTAMVDALGHRTTYRYDDAGKLLETTFHDGTSVSVVYDQLSRKVSETDQAGRTTYYDYDKLGRLITVTLPPAKPGDAPSITRYAYDEWGNRITQTDAAGRVTRWTHDSQGREISRTLPLGQHESMAYDLLGNRVSSTDFRGRAVGYTYDDQNRLTGIDYPTDHDVTMTYTPEGQRATAVDGRGTSSWGYDERHRLVTATDAEGRVITYTYDKAGNLLSRVSPAATHTYTYDALNRLSTVTATVAGDAPRVTTYTYDAVGNRATMTGAEGTQTVYSYDDLNRLTHLVKRTAANAPLFEATYTLDPSGMRTHVAENDDQGHLRDVTWTYDGQKRLTGEAISHRDTTVTRNATWTYDAVGNRLTQTIVRGVGPTHVTTYTYDDNDRLLTESEQIGSVAAVQTLYAYDAQGNTTGKSKLGELMEYAYDDANRMVEFRSGGNRTTYQYNVDGIRTAQTSFSGATSTETQYLVDGNHAYAQVAEEWISENNASAKLGVVFSYGDDIISQVRCTPNSVTTCANASYSALHADGFGSTRALTNSAGTATDRYEFDAWGETAHVSGITPTEHLYRGEQIDSALRQYNLRARWMDPRNGRFTTSDRYPGVVQDPPTLHRYLYANASPTRYADPTGYFSMTEMMSALSSAANIYSNAISAISLFDPDLAESIDSSVPSIIDYLLPSLIRMAGSAIGSPPEVGVAVSGIYATAATGSGIELHHTIPVYLCGCERQKTVPMYRTDHWFVHGEMALLEATIETMGKSFQFVFKRSKAGTANRRYVRAAARTTNGRTAIAAAIGSIYYGSGYWTYSLGGFTPLGAVFTEESGRFIASRANSSYPICSRSL